MITEMKLIYTRYMQFAPRKDHTKEGGSKIAQACMLASRNVYLLQEVEVDPQNHLPNSHLKQQSLQVLIEQQAAEEAT